MRGQSRVHGMQPLDMLVKYCQEETRISTNHGWYQTEEQVAGRGWLKVYSLSFFMFYILYFVYLLPVP